MKCESCPNRPCDEKKAACDNCIQRKKKADLAGVLSLSFDCFLKKPLKEELAERPDEEIAELMRREEEDIQAIKRKEARRERDREIREECRKGWWK